jgi:hypothetical protein
MITTITTFATDTPSPPSAIERFFDVAYTHEYFAFAALVYAGTLQEFFVSADGQYAELRLSWADDAEYSAWFDNQEIQTIRTQYEPGFFSTVRDSGVVLTRYLPWDDAEVDSLAKQSVVYAPPPFELLSFTAPA